MNVGFFAYLVCRQTIDEIEFYLQCLTWHPKSEVIHYLNFGGLRLRELGQHPKSLLVALLASVDRLLLLIAVPNLAPKVTICSA